MKKVIVEPTLRSQFNGLTEPMELCDEKGQTVGHFLPVELYWKLNYAAAEAACPFSMEEIERRRQETGARPLADLWKTLGVQ